MRRNRRQLLVLALLGVLLAACGRDTPELPGLAYDDRILAFGNSLTHGTGASADASYPAVLAERIDREVINAGEPGERTDAARERLPEVLAETDPDLLLLLHGGNDFLDNRDAATTRRNIAAMIETAREHDVAVLLVGVPERALPLATAPLYHELAEQHDLPLVGEALADILGDSSLRADRVHPNAEGYARLAAAVHETLGAAGAVAPP